MNTVQININTEVNPCIYTKNGRYVPQNHQIYVTCNARQTNLYSQYGWFLGSIYISSPDLLKIKKSRFSQLLKQIEEESNLTITDTRDNLKTLAFLVVNCVIAKLNKKLCLPNPIKVSTSYLKI